MRIRFYNPDDRIKARDIKLVWGRIIFKMEESSLFKYVPKH